LSSKKFTSPKDFFACYYASILSYPVRSKIFLSEKTEYALKIVDESITIYVDQQQLIRDLAKRTGFAKAAIYRRALDYYFNPPDLK
jgi:hypothetical protein